MSTALPRGTIDPSPGFVEIGLPFAGPYTWPACSPAFSRIAIASSSFLCPIAGTAMRSGPFDTLTVTVAPRGALSPVAGCVDTTCQAGTVSLNTSTCLAFSCTLVNAALASANEPLIGGTCRGAGPFDTTRLTDDPL